jgi:hypothetical protein
VSAWEREENGECAGGGGRRGEVVALAGRASRPRGVVALTRSGARGAAAAASGRREERRARRGPG